MRWRRKLLRRVQRLRKQSKSLLAIAWWVAGQKRLRVAILSMGDEGPCPHLFIHLERVLEVLFCFIP